MFITTKAKFVWDNDLKQYVEVFTEGYEYEGELALCDIEEGVVEWVSVINPSGSLGSWATVQWKSDARSIGWTDLSPSTADLVGIPYPVDLQMRVKPSGGTFPHPYKDDDKFAVRWKIARYDWHQTEEYWDFDEYIFQNCDTNPSYAKVFDFQDFDSVNRPGVSRKFKLYLEVDDIGTDYGVTIKNNDSEIQIDGLYSNYAVGAFGTFDQASGAGYAVHTNQGWSTSSSGEAIYEGFELAIETFTISYGTSFISPPLIAIEPLTRTISSQEVSTPIAFHGHSISAGKYSGFKVYRSKASNRNGYKFNWRAYVPSDELTPSGDYGVQIRNGDDGYVFDSRLSYMRIRDIVDVNLGSHDYPAHGNTTGWGYTDWNSSNPQLHGYWHTNTSYCGSEQSYFYNRPKSSSSVASTNPHYDDGSSGSVGAWEVRWKTHASVDNPFYIVNNTNVGGFGYQSALGNLYPRTEVWSTCAIYKQDSAPFGGATDTGSPAYQPVNTYETKVGLTMAIVGLNKCSVNNVWPDGYQPFVYQLIVVE